jgi:hypothetical protein
LGQPILKDAFVLSSNNIRYSKAVDLNDSSPKGYGTTACRQKRKRKKRGKENICLLTTISEASSDYQKNPNFLVYGAGGYICIGGMSVLVVVIAF